MYRSRLVRLRDVPAVGCSIPKHNGLVLASYNPITECDGKMKVYGFQTFDLFHHVQQRVNTNAVE